MLNQISTEEHFNNLIQFRQALYEHGFTKRTDAQFELLDALLLSGAINSFAELSLSLVFRRKWPSAYAAIEDGRQDASWLKRYLCAKVPTQGVQLFALDGSGWPRPKAETLPDRQYVSPVRLASTSILQALPFAAAPLWWAIPTRCFLGWQSQRALGHCPFPSSASKAQPML
jgi:hypothetical protein